MQDNDQVQGQSAEGGEGFSEAAPFLLTMANLGPWQREVGKTGPLKKDERRAKAAHEIARMEAIAVLFSCANGARGVLGTRAATIKRLREELQRQMQEASAAARKAAADATQHDILVERLLLVFGILCAESGVRPTAVSLSGANEELTLTPKFSGSLTSLTAHANGGRAQLGKRNVVGASWDGTQPDDVTYAALAGVLRARAAEEAANPDPIDAIVAAIMALSGAHTGLLRVALARIYDELGSAL